MDGRYSHRQHVLAGILLAFLTGCAPHVAPISLKQEPALPVAPRLDVPGSPIAPGTLVELRTDGALRAVDVTAADGAVLPGTTAPDGRLWTASRTAKLGATYTVAATVEGANGEQQLSGSFVTVGLGNAERLTVDVEPASGMEVGVGAPVAVRFDQEVQDRAAVERAFVVSTSTPVTGAWHWVDARHVRFRPEHYWPAHTTVRVALALEGVRAGPDLVGGRDYETTFTVGSSVISKVDAKAFTMTVLEEGKPPVTWPTSLGQPKFATRTGTYAVLAKERHKQMTACRANITCDKSNPEWFDLPVDYNVRLTWSGAFVHAAPWSAGSQGRANVSHGCINLSLRNARTFFELAKYGDVVEVTGTSRTSADLVEGGDPGMVDWNKPWPEYVAGSALGQPVVTGALVSG